MSASPTSPTSPTSATAVGTPATPASRTVLASRTALAAAVALTLLGGTALAAPAAAADGPLPTQSLSAQAVAVTVSAYSPAHVPLSRPAVAAKGTVRGFPTGARVRLQRRVGTGWSAVGTPRSLSGAGAFQFKVTHSAEGFNTYRVQVVTTSRTLATSQTLTTHVHRFTASSPGPRSTATTGGAAALSRPGTATGARASSAAFAINGDLTCRQFSFGSLTQLTPPHRTTVTGGIVYWVPEYYSSSGGAWQYAGSGAIAYSTADSMGATSYWWDYATGNQVRTREAAWNPGFLIAAYNYVSPGGQWYAHGYSPAADGSGNEFCAV